MTSVPSCPPAAEPRLQIGRRFDTGKAAPSELPHQVRSVFLSTFRRDCVVTPRSEEHTSELQSPCNLVCRLLLEKKNTNPASPFHLSPPSTLHRPLAIPDHFSSLIAAVFPSPHVRHHPRHSRYIAAISILSSHLP